MTSWSYFFKDLLNLGFNLLVALFGTKLQLLKDLFHSVIDLHGLFGGEHLLTFFTVLQLTALSFSVDVRGCLFFDLFTVVQGFRGYECFVNVVIYLDAGAVNLYRPYQLAFKLGPSEIHG